MPNGDDGLFVSGTKDDKKKDPRDTQQNENIKATLDSVSNEVNLLLMDQEMSEEEKQIATDMLATVSMTKESTNQSQTEEVDGELMNDQIIDNGVQETEEQQENGLLNEQLGEQMSLKVDVAQPSFEVQQVPQAPAPAQRRGGFFRFFKSMMSVITSCLLIKPIARWRNKSKSKSMLYQAKERELQLAQRVNDRESINLQEAQQGEQKNEQKQNLIADVSKAPVVWEQVQGYSDKEQAPTVEAHAKQVEAGSRYDMSDTTHSFIVLRYSKEDYRTGKMRRYRLAFGLYPRFSVNMLPQVGVSATIPGVLNNEASSVSTSGRSYNITNEQVNTILSETPKVVDKGYNMITQNCTTFVVDLLKSVGLADAGLQEETLDIGNYEVIKSLAIAPSALSLGTVRSTLLRRMNSEDYDFTRSGEQLVTYKDIERFEDSLRFDETEAVGYGPGMFGEQLRSANISDGSARNVVTIQEFSRMIDPAEINAKYRLVEKYEEAPVIAGVKKNIIDPIVELMQEVQSLDVPLNNKSSELLKYTIEEERTKFLTNTEEFDRRKGELETAVQGWLGKLNSVRDRELHLLGYQLIGEVAAIEKKFYLAHDSVNNLSNKLGINQSSEADLYEVLSPTGVFTNSFYGNLLMRKSFAMVFGDQSYDYILNRSNETSEGKSKSEAAALKKEKEMIGKKMKNVNDRYIAESYQFRKFTKQNNFTQEQVDEAFELSAPMENLEGSLSNQKVQKSKNRLANDIREASSLVIMTKVFQSAKSKFASVMDACSKISDENGVQANDYVVNCKVCVGIFEILQTSIESQESDLFTKIVRTIANRDDADKDYVTEELLGCIFAQYVQTIMKDTSLPIGFILGMQMENGVSPNKSYPQAYANFTKTRTKFVSFIEAIVEKVLADKQEAVV